MEKELLNIFNKELLLKDLCARLPYGVKVRFYDYLVEEYEIIPLTAKLLLYTVQIGEIPPYLFPISSMTEEQKKEYEDALTYHDYVEGGWDIAKSFDNEYIIPYWFVDFCNKNHFDYRGLIEKGLAIDATGLNIY